MIRRFAVFALLCAALAGCDSILGSDTPTGIYQLDVSSPVVLENGDVRIHILQDVLTLKADGTAHRTARERVEFTSGAFPDTTRVVEQEFLYRANGWRIELESVCGPAALCAAPPHVWGRATEDGDVLELRMLFDPDVRLTYRDVES
jgi:hypothetical protein